MVESLESRLRKVQEDFLRGVPQRIAEFLKLWDDPHPWQERLKLAHHLAHRLAGGSGTLGQPDLSAAAKSLELDLQALIEAGAEPGEDTLAQFRERIARLIESTQDLP